MNRVLLFLVLVPLILFAWFSGYYSNSIGKISKNCTISVGAEYSVPSPDIVSNLKKDKELLEQGYANIRSEKEAVELEKQRLDEYSKSLKVECDTAQSTTSVYESRYNEIQGRLSTANEQISSLISKNNELCSRLQEKGGNC